MLTRYGFFIIFALSSVASNFILRYLLHVHIHARLLGLAENLVEGGSVVGQMSVL